MTDSHKYFTIHHSEKDIFEEVDKKELELCAATLTSIIYLINRYGIESIAILWIRLMTISF